MADFDKAMGLILKYEGTEYVNDPNDYGGETKYGISKRAHPEVDIKNLTLDQAKDIYRRDYWNKIFGDSILYQGLAEEMMDIAVNLHWTVAVRWLQHSYNELMSCADADAPDTLLEDGIIGPKTLEAVNTYKWQKDLIKMLNGYQFMHYMKRIDEDESQRKFLRSWIRRVEFREG